MRYIDLFFLTYFTLLMYGLVVGITIEAPKAPRWRRQRKFTPDYRERCKLSRRVRGGNPAKNGFYACLVQQNTSSDTKLVFDDLSWFCEQQRKIHHRYFL